MLEKYLIPILVALTVLVIFTNPMNLDWTQRITGGLALLFAAYFFAHTVHNANRSKDTTPASFPGGGAGIIFPVLEQFTGLYRVAVDQLGATKNEAQVSEDAYFGKHQRAVVLHVLELKAHFILKSEGRACEESPDPDESTDKAWYDEPSLRLILSPPKGFCPPQGGIAKKWASDPSVWLNKIGWREWHMGFFGSIHYQEFERGLIVGAFPSNNAATSGQVFAIFNDGHWTSRASPPAKHYEIPASVLPVPIRPIPAKRPHIGQR